MGSFSQAFRAESWAVKLGTLDSYPFGQLPGGLTRLSEMWHRKGCILPDAVAFTDPAQWSYSGLTGN